MPKSEWMFIKWFPDNQNDNNITTLRYLAHILFFWGTPKGSQSIPTDLKVTRQNKLRDKNTSTSQTAQTCPKYIVNSRKTTPAIGVQFPSFNLW